jgi:hypothetical protein
MLEADRLSAQGARFWAQMLPLIALIGGGALLSGFWLLRTVSLEWSLLTLASVGGGVMMLSAARRRQGFLTAPQWMLVASALLMYIGLAFDVSRDRVLAISEVCSAAAPTIGSLGGWLRHVEAMPMMHAGMLAGGVAAIFIVRARARRSCRRALCAHAGINLLCSLTMLLGMYAGMVAFALTARFTGFPWNGMAMLGGMVAGMVWAMLGLVRFYRYMFSWVDEQAVGLRT